MTDDTSPPAAAPEGPAGAAYDQPSSNCSKHNGGSVSGGRTDNSSLPLIEIEQGQLPRIVDEAEAALLKLNSGLYQRGSMIVRLAKSEIAVTGGHTVAGFRLVPVPVTHMVECMTRAARWRKFEGRANKFVAKDCPKLIAETYLAREGSWNLSVLRGVIFAPTLRADGTVLDQPGYDRATRLHLVTDGSHFPKIADPPSRADAERALATLLSPFAKFPFLSPADTAVMLSAILTALVRQSLPHAPLHAFSAPVAGSGKSLLVDAASMISTGRQASVIAQGKTEEEMEKRLGAALIAGDTTISIDNCEAPLRSDFLCQVLTQPFLKVRVLGLSKLAEVPSSAVVFATGNNLISAGDLTRRTLLCTLDPICERPEQREFDTDPLEIIRLDRGTYVTSALTIMRAYCVAGRPPQKPPIGSFVEWCRMVRDPLMWLGVADPCSTMEITRTIDPTLSNLAAVLEQWREVIGNRAVSVKQVIEYAMVRTDDHDGAEFMNPDLREALLAVAGERGMISSRRFGKWLSSNQGRVVGACRILRKNGRAGVAHWQLEDRGS